MSIVDQPSKMQKIEDIVYLEDTESELSEDEPTLYICDICDKICSAPHQLKLHKKTHIKKESFECSKCSKTFKYLSILTSHEKRHKNDKYYDKEQKVYKCDKCEKSYEKVCHFANHQRTHQLVIRKDARDKVPKDGSKILKIISHECILCPEKFETPIALIEHSSSHLL